MSGFQVGGDRLTDGGNGIMAALFQRAEDAHQDGLAVGASLAAVSITVFANDDGRANGPFRMVVVEGNARLIQECEQIVAMTAQAFDQTFGLPVFPRRIDQLAEPLVQPVAAGLGLLGRQLVLSVPQTNRVGHQSPELLRKSGPVFAGPFVFVHVLQVAQQMHQARLPQRTVCRSAQSTALSAPPKSLTNVPENSWMKNFISAGEPRERSIMSSVKSGVQKHHNQWVLPSTRQPVSSACNTADCRACCWISSYQA